MKAALSTTDGSNAASLPLAKRRRLEPGQFHANPLGADEQRLQIFRNWLQEAHAVDLEALGLEIRSSPRHGVGVFAVRRLLPGTTFAKIPTAATLHAGNARASEFGKRILAALETSSKVSIAPEELLWLYMIWGRSEPVECPWYGYLQSLPLESPAAWMSDVTAVDWLMGTPLADHAQHELQQQRDRYNEVMNELQSASANVLPVSRFRFEDWMWARSCYNSRAFKHHAFPGDCFEPGWESDVLCPLLDAFNHIPDAEVEWRFGESSALFLLPLSADAYEPGDEVFILYGAALGNDKLLSQYGFAVKNNQYDSVKDIVFEVPCVQVASKLQELRAANFVQAEEEASQKGGASLACIRITLAQGLCRGLSEVPEELLRAASFLVLGRDYHGADATCADRRDTSKAVAKALQRMQRKTHVAVVQPVRCPLKQRRYWGVRAGKPRRRMSLVPLPSDWPALAAGLYARGYYQVLREAASCAQTESEMAELAAQMEPASDNDTVDACE